MELKEVIAELKVFSERYTEISEPFWKNLQTAISYLETLQKVEEMTGVKKKEFNNNPNNNPLEDINYQGYIRGFNEALALKDAELARKLEGLQNWLKQNIRMDMSICVGGLGTSQILNDDGYRRIANAIQELILGKKAEGK